MAKGQTGPAAETSSLDDFELVRNGEGQWLLVLPALPDQDTIHATLPTRAELVGDEIILSDDRTNLVLQSLVAPHYAQTLRGDKPTHILLCVVDDDGNNRLLSKLPFRCQPE